MSDCTFVETAFSHFIPELIGAVLSTALIGAGLLAAVVFPVLLLLCLSRAGKRSRNEEVIGEAV